METKNQDEFISKTFDWMGYAHRFTIPPEGLSGGLALYWKENVEVEILEAAPNFIDVKVKFKKDTSHITFIYGAPKLRIVLFSGIRSHP